MNVWLLFISASAWVLKNCQFLLISTSTCVIPFKESNTFGMTIDKHTIFETSNPLTESVKNLPGITYESRVLGHFQNPELFHSPASLPKLTPSPDVKNRSHLSSINNKPLVLNISNPRFPPINSSKSTTTNDFSGLWVSCWFCYYDIYYILHLYSRTG